MSEIDFKPVAIGKRGYHLDFTFYWGKFNLHIRKFHETEGTNYPTRFGICLRVDEWDAFCEHETVFRTNLHNGINSDIFKLGKRQFYGFTSVYNGVPLCHIRKFDVATTGDLFPTSCGVTLKIDEFDAAMKYKDQIYKKFRMIPFDHSLPKPKMYQAQQAMLTSSTKNDSRAASAPSTPLRPSMDAKSKTDSTVQGASGNVIKTYADVVAKSASPPPPPQPPKASTKAASAPPPPPRPSSRRATINDVNGDVDDDDDGDHNYAIKGKTQWLPEFKTPSPSKDSSRIDPYIMAKVIS